MHHLIFQKEDKLGEEQKIELGKELSPGTREDSKVAGGFKLDVKFPFYVAKKYYNDTN